ncbi:MAG: NAD-dependent epimerase/dehydratase family protein [Actinomycetota bacterium]|nr:NAD-dependent epimerase/dehydratase family protein [Actinomycetota bacterium]
MTGVAGFIGSNLLEFFLKKGFNVTGLDNFATGSKENIDDVINTVSSSRQKIRFKFIKGDIRKYSDCLKATKNIDVVFHQAALGSVQRSIDKPFDSNDTNVSGTLNMLKASADNKVKRFIFASSSSVYGDSEVLPKKEDMNTNPRSIYAVSKLASEYYTRLFYNIYGLETISLRYFNVFGRRQSPDSIYSAVIPVFIKNLKSGKPLTIFGDGNQSRDFTYIDNVIYANYLAMISKNNNIFGNYYNVGCGERVSLNEIVKYLERKKGERIEVIYEEERKGDVRSSLASLEKIKKDLNYRPLVEFFRGLDSLID